MERRADRQRHGAADAEFGRKLCRAADCRLGTADDDLAGRIVVGDLADAVLRRGGGGQLFSRFKIGAEQRQHGPLSCRDGLLHRKPAQAQELGRIGQREHPRRGKGRVLA